MLWVMETAPHKLGMATETSLVHDGATPGFSGIFHLQKERTSPSLSPLPDAIVLEEVTPPPDRSPFRGAIAQPMGQSVVNVPLTNGTHLFQESMYLDLTSSPYDRDGDKTDNL